MQLLYFDIFMHYWVWRMLSVLASVPWFKSSKDRVGITSWIAMAHKSLSCKPGSNLKSPLHCILTGCSSSGQPLFLEQSAHPILQEAKFTVRSLHIQIFVIYISRFVRATQSGNVWYNGKVLLKVQILSVQAFNTMIINQQRIKCYSSFKCNLNVIIHS